MNFNVGSIWTASDGRTMIVTGRENEGWGKQLICKRVELLIAQELRYVTRPLDELQVLSKNGQLNYSGECKRD